MTAEDPQTPKTAQHNRLLAFFQNKQNLIFVAGLLGILLLALTRLPQMAKPAMAAVEAAQGETAKGYEQQLEQRLEDILGNIAGVGRVQVMVTLESGHRYEYAKQNKESSDRLEDTHDTKSQKTQEKSISEENYVMVDSSGGGKQPLVTNELEPQVKGVVVVCEGGENPVIVAHIVETVKVAVNLASNRIAVSLMRQNIP
ncbi:MAG: hypothetical protein RR022_04510 [Angelakisella sp.]